MAVKTIWDTQQIFMCFRQPLSSGLGMATIFEEEEEPDTLFEEEEEFDDELAKWKEQPLSLNLNCYMVHKYRSFEPTRRYRLYPEEEENKIKEGAQKLAPKIKLRAQTRAHKVIDGQLLLKVLQQILLFGHFILHCLDITSNCKKKTNMVYIYEKAAVIIIWRCGDVERNPGPPEVSRILRDFSKTMFSLLITIYWENRGVHLNKADYKNIPDGWNEQVVTFKDPSKCTNKHRDDMLQHLLGLYLSHGFAIPQDLSILINKYQRLPVNQCSEREQSIKALQTWVETRQRNKHLNQLFLQLPEKQASDQIDEVAGALDAVETIIPSLKPSAAQALKAKLNSICLLLDGRIKEQTTDTGLAVDSNYCVQGNTDDDDAADDAGAQQSKVNVCLLLPAEMQTKTLGLPQICSLETNLSITSSSIISVSPSEVVASSSVHNLVDNDIYYRSYENPSSMQDSIQKDLGNGISDSNQVWVRKRKLLSNTGNRHSPAKRQPVSAEWDIPQTLDTVNGAVDGTETAIDDVNEMFRREEQSTCVTADVDAISQSDYYNQEENPISWRLCDDIFDQDIPDDLNNLKVDSLLQDTIDLS